ncbi:MAG: hypothetical protein RIT04_411 [Candidatus Parcubacteria bacterium]|jgi:micrococcal nuclease
MKKKSGISWIIFVGVILVIIAGVVIYFAQPASGLNKASRRVTIDPDQAYRVERVIDGDTLVARVNGQEATIRLIGMDTPEVVDPRKPPQCYGLEASDEAKKLLSGKYVYLEPDPMKTTYDKYHRVLAYLYLSEKTATSSTRGALYNQLMIEHGYAREYTFSHEPYTHQADFIAAEDRARRDGVGLWDNKTCNGGRNTL